MTEPQATQIIQLLTEIRDLLKPQGSSRPASSGQGRSNNGHNTYAKLKSGEWGVRTIKEPKPGDKIEVHTKGGAVKQETIKDMVHRGFDRESGQSYFLCSIVQKPKGQNEAPAASAPVAEPEQDDVPF